MMIDQKNGVHEAECDCEECFEVQCQNEERESEYKAQMREAYD